MRSTDLRLGNIVAAIDEPFKPDYVVVLEPGLVYLMGREEADDEQNIIPVPVSSEMLATYDIPCEVTFSLSGHEVRICMQESRECATLILNGAHVDFHYLHEMQNLIHALCGEDIIRHPHVHLENETY
jgi:hypothetical protein